MVHKVHKVWTIAFFCLINGTGCRLFLSICQCHLFDQRRYDMGHRFQAWTGSIAATERAQAQKHEHAAARGQLKIEKRVCLRRGRGKCRLRRPGAGHCHLLRPLPQGELRLSPVPCLVFEVHDHHYPKNDIVSHGPLTWRWSQPKPAVVFCFFLCHTACFGGRIPWQAGF